MVKGMWREEFEKGENFSVTGYKFQCAVSVVKRWLNS